MGNAIFGAHFWATGYGHLRVVRKLMGERRECIYDPKNWKRSVSRTRICQKMKLFSSDKYLFYRQRFSTLFSGSEAKIGKSERGEGLFSFLSSGDMRKLREAEKSYTKSRVRTPTNLFGTGMVVKARRFER